MSGLVDIEVKTGRYFAGETGVAMFEGTVQHFGKFTFLFIPTKCFFGANYGTRAGPLAQLSIKT